MRISRFVKHGVIVISTTLVLKEEKPSLGFLGPWCGPCRAMGDFRRAGLNTAKGQHSQMNVDDQSATASQYAVKSIPTLILVKNGKVQDTKIGLLSKNQLVVC